jgi:DNA-binding MarR family transcriptional regulator
MELAGRGIGMDRLGLLVSYSKKFTIHRRMWETEWNRRNTTEMTYPQFQILSILNREGPKQSKDLVNYLSITSGGITGISDKLISQGLISRARDDHKDRRAIYLEITDQGRSILGTLEQIRDDVFNTLFACLTDAEIAFLDQIYGKIVGYKNGMDKAQK